MTTVLTYSELICGAIGIILLIFAFLYSINLIIKTTGRLKRIAIYFLIGSIISEGYIIGRLTNIEVLLPIGKLIGLIIVLMVSLLVFLITRELNIIVKGIIGNRRVKPEGKTKMEIGTNNKKTEKRVSARTFAQNISNKYLDLTGRRPRYR